MDENLVFLHSAGWRTGSTYLFGKFRALDHVTAYYEPFNEVLKNIDSEKIHGTRLLMNHPKDTKPYFLEYERFLEESGGISLFKPHFPYNHFFSYHDDITPYLRNLAEHSENREIVFFGFTRSAGRIQGIRERFGGVHIYLHRDLRDQWVSMNRSEIDLRVMQVIFVENQTSPVFEPFRRGRDLHFGTREEFLYFLFLYIQKVFDRIAERHADTRIDLSRVSADSAKEIEERVFELTSCRILLDDMNLPTYSEEIRNTYCFERVEALADSYLQELPVDLC
jgi:hypothetical protein